MYDSSFAPPPLIPSPAQKHSKIGIASFVVGILAALVFCLVILLAFGFDFLMAAQNPTFQINQNSPTVLSLGLVMCLSPVLSLVGVGLGIAAVLQKNVKKLFGILGLVLNLMTILTFCILVGIGFVAQSGAITLPSY